MSWLDLPLSHKHPFWDEEWGLHLLRDCDDKRDKTNNRVFGTSDKELFAILGDYLAHCFGPVRELFLVCNNGSTALNVALGEAAPPSTIRLIGIGSYAGAFNFGEKLSSAPETIENFYRRNKRDLEYIVPLPYMMKTQMLTEWGDTFEDNCIDAFKERLLGFAMRGTPVGCISVELMLSGNGLQLSSRFCSNLRTLCFFANVAIVADEVATGFRCCSEPTFLLSDELMLQPNFIVLGKFLGCGLVLRDTHVTSSRWAQRDRRTPTTTSSWEQALGLKHAMEKACDMCSDHKTMFSQVEKAVREEYPDAVGHGLMWFFNSRNTPPVPCPNGIQRLLMKFCPKPWDSDAFKTELKKFFHSKNGDDNGTELDEHIHSFQAVIENFANGWHNRKCPLFKQKAHSVFGVAYCANLVHKSEVLVQGLKEFYGYVNDNVSSIDKTTARRIVVGMQENCDDNTLFFQSSYGPGRKKCFKLTPFAKTFLCWERKRKHPLAPAAPTPAPAAAAAAAANS